MFLKLSIFMLVFVEGGGYFRLFHVQSPVSSQVCIQT